MARELPCHGGTGKASKMPPPLPAASLGAAAPHLLSRALTKGFAPYRVGGRTAGSSCLGDTGPGPSCYAILLTSPWAQSQVAQDPCAGDRPPVTFVVGAGRRGGAHASCPSSFTRAEAAEERTGSVSKINLSDVLAGIVYAQTVQNRSSERFEMGP